jgi:RsiW-degrading membrane proteinase PrsW (M82 family)
MGESSPAVPKVQRKSLLVSNLATLLLLAVFLGLVFGVDALLKPVFSPVGLIITGILLALVPAVLWIGFFYRQDRREPEPKGMVLQVFVMGALLAAAIGIPLIDNLFQVGNWIYDSLLANILGGILIFGFTQEFLKYAAVRYSVYATEEFDERTDGIVYATAAGLGYATILSVMFVVNSGGVDLGMAAIRIVLTALAQASFAGISGYFLASEKLDKRPAWWMPLGLVIAAVLNGLFFFLVGMLNRTTIRTGGGFVNPWWGLILAAALAVGITAVLTWLIQRDQARQEGAGAVGDTSGKLSTLPRTAGISALVVLALVALALIGGGLLKGSVEGAVTHVENLGVSADYPARWQINTGAVTQIGSGSDTTASASIYVFSGSDPFDNYQKYEVSLLPGGSEAAYEELAFTRNLQRAQQLTSYSIVDQFAVQFNGENAYEVHFAYVDTGGLHTVPVVIEGLDYYFLKGDKTLLVTLEERSELFDQAQPRFFQFMQSVRWTP